MCTHQDLPKAIGEVIRTGASFAVALVLVGMTTGCGGSSAKSPNAVSHGGTTGPVGGGNPVANADPACAAIQQSWTAFLTRLTTTGTTAYGKLVDELRDDGQGSQDLDLEDAVSNLESDSIEAAQARLPDYPDRVAKVQQDVQAINGLCKMSLPTAIPSPKI